MNKFRSLRKFNPVLKICILLIAFWFLYRELFIKHDIRELGILLEKAAAGPGFGFLGSLVLVLMLLNWSLEALKWKIMMSELEQVSFFTALEAVFSGVTVSFFTPNRVGEFAGRIFFLEKADKIKAAFISILGSMSQLIITLLAGCAALVFYLKKFTGIDITLVYATAFISAVFLLLVLAAFFNVGSLYALLRKLGLPDKYTGFTHAAELYSASRLLLVLVISGVRFIVFSFQFYLLLCILDVNVNLMPALCMISMTYFVMAIPAFALAELGMRSVVSVQFIGLLSHNTGGIIAASFILYIVNVALAAVIGGIFVFNLKFFRK